nr:C13 family peptidase [Candidatus Sigynarchaeota archaeon]
MAGSKKSKKGLVASIILVLIGLNVVQFVYFTWLRPSGVPQADSPLQVSDITGSGRPNYVGKTLTIDGYYFAGPNNQSTITQNGTDFFQNKILPVTSYLKIIGPIPQGLVVNDSGSRILLKGVIQIDTGNSSITDISPISATIIENTRRPYYEYLYPIIIQLPSFLIPTKYAVLISGGWDSDHAYIRYWNDLKFMYAALTGFYNYSASHIIVIYKDGTPEDAGMPVNYSCSYSNIQAAFSHLASVMSDRDDLFIYTTNHGGGGALCLWNHDVIVPSQMAGMLNAITYHHMIIVMEQCFSGCFIPNLSGTNRVIMTAANAEESSWSCDTEGPFDEFVFHFMMAVRQISLLGDPVYSDANHDGKVSMVEAFNHACYMDSANEHPQYDDNGDGVGHPYWLPYSTDGYAGANFFL